MEQQEEGRYCWVCFATDEDDVLSPWVQPCACKGTTRWVHSYCLSRWIDEKQKGNSFKKVSCPQCQTDYIIVFPSMGTLANILEGVDTLARRVSPLLTAGLIVGSLYWTAVTYGAITILQVTGYHEGFKLMDNTDPMMLLVALPAIPVTLILSRMIRWEDLVLKLIQARHTRLRKFPLISLILPVADVDEEVLNMAASSHSPVSQTSDPLSVPRILCGALLLPSIASLIGHAFFDSIQNNLHRTLFGGLTFIVVKGALKIYFKQKQYKRKKQRRILDYTPENVRLFGNREPTGLRRDDYNFGSD